MMFVASTIFNQSMFIFLSHMDESVFTLFVKFGWYVRCNWWLFGNHSSSCRGSSFLSSLSVHPSSMMMVNHFSPVEFEYTFEVSSSVSTPMGSPAESVLDFGDAELLDFAPYEVDFSEMDFQSETDADSKRQRRPSCSNAPMLYHRNLPVFSMSPNAVETEQAMQSVLQCPDQCLSTELPKMVTENYCFVVDGDKYSISDITADDDYWRPTGRPTKYYYSDDLKTFQKVHVVKLKGKIISAKLVAPRFGVMGRSHSMSMPASSSNRLRPSEPGSATISPPGAGGGAMNVFLLKRQKAQVETKEVSLDYVYKVTRSYSFWKTCTTFHRIITVVSPLNVNAAHPDFKRRIFVQYLWRNAKESDKNRVLSEFDPKKSVLMKRINTPTDRSVSPSSPLRPFHFWMCFVWIVFFVHIY